MKTKVLQITFIVGFLFNPEYHTCYFNTSKGDTEFYYNNKLSNKNENKKRSRFRKI